MESGRSRSYDVLLVESDPDDIAPFIDSFEATDRTNEVHVVSNGDSALDFLHRRGDYAHVPRPDLVLLDLQLPGTNGVEILRELAEHPPLRLLPVIVLTDSEAAEDIARSYKLNANAYVQKPTTPDGFDELAQAIEEFWLNVARLPPK